jgi:hypothetical protein
MAGAIAEMIFLENRCGGDWADLAKIERLISDDPGDRVKLRRVAATRMLIARHRTQIERLIKMLCIYYTAKAARLTSRGVNHVQSSLGADSVGSKLSVPGVELSPPGQGAHRPTNVRVGVPVQTDLHEDEYASLDTVPSSASKVVSKG